MQRYQNENGLRVRFDDSKLKDECYSSLTNPRARNKIFHSDDKPNLTAEDREIGKNRITTPNFRKQTTEETTPKNDKSFQKRKKTNNQPR